MHDMGSQAANRLSTSPLRLNKSEANVAGPSWRFVKGHGRALVSGVDKQTTMLRVASLLDI